MPLRKIRDADEAARCLTACRASGYPRAAWARREGIDPRSLNAWRLNLERSDVCLPPRLVELVPTTCAPEAAAYRVRCGSLVVEVDEHFDAAVLRRLLGVVASC